MNTIVQLFISGIAMGFIYALVAIEYTLIWNSCRLLNFAHTQIIMFGAYVFGFLFVKTLGFDYWIAAICALVVMGGFGVILAKTIFIPLHKKVRLYTTIATMLLGLILVEATNFIFAPFSFTLKSYLTGSVLVFGATISIANLCIIGTALVIVVGLLLFMQKTKVGKAMRCVAENSDTAAYMGINVSRNMAITIAISCMICTVIGMLIIPLYSIRTTMANMVGLKGFAAGIVGGFGSVTGAVFGGILIGILENFAALALPAVYKDIVAYLSVLVVLMLRPKGLFVASQKNAFRQRRKMQAERGKA